MKHRADNTVVCITHIIQKEIFIIAIACGLAAILHPADAQAEIITRRAPGRDGFLMRLPRKKFAADADDSM